MRQDEAPAPNRAAIVWLVPLVALLAAGVGLAALTAWVENVDFGFAAGVADWLLALDNETAAGTLSNAAEVVAAVLAIAITVVAIVVELAANRYTHRITQLFVRTPLNGVVIGFFVLTTLYCMWIGASLSGSRAESVPHGAVAIAMAMVTLSLLVLLPYFAFVFAFLQPKSVVERIRDHAVAEVRRARRWYRDERRHALVRNIEELEDVALNAMQHRDRSIAFASVDALYGFLREYEALRDGLDDAWFAIDRRLTRDAAFIAMAPSVREVLDERKLWVEMKVFRQWHTIYMDALNDVRGAAYLVAANSQGIAALALEMGRLEVFDLAVRFYNSYLRAAVNGRDVRTAYYTLHHYRQVAEAALRAGQPERAVVIAGYLKYYGQVAFTSKLPFLLETIAYDMAILAEVAFEYGMVEAQDLLDLLLSVDREGEGGVQEQSMLGVRRAQARIATFFLARGDEARARLVWRDMDRESGARLAAVRDELLQAVESDYWEVTDRGVNFAYLPPERRAKVRIFFGWFGDRLPPPPPEAVVTPPPDLAGPTLADEFLDREAEKPLARPTRAGVG